MKVEIGFDLSLTDPSLFFVLDDPVRGVLDNTVYPLGGDVLVDVTAYTRAVSIRRGRARELDKFTAANVAVTLDNRARTFDPLYSSGPYYGSILPGKPVAVSVDDAARFVGTVEDWNYGYDVSGDSIAEPSCVDALAMLSRTPLAGGTQTAETTGVRVAAILDDVSWPASRRDISDGQATLVADVVEDGTKALDYLQQVALSDPGALFVNRAGAVTFRDRADLQDATSAVAFGGTAGIPYMTLEPVYGTEELVNVASVIWSAGTAVGGTATATNAASVTAYGTYEQSFDTLLASEAAAQDYADWIVARYGVPKYRVDRVTVRLEALATAHRAQVLALDLGDACTVEFTPNGIGSAVVQTVAIDSIEESATPQVHDITFTFSETLAAFTLDSASLGVLDSDVLGY